MLESFLEEANAYDESSANAGTGNNQEVSSNETKSSSKKLKEDEKNKLFLNGCNDWDHMTGKDAAGLDTLYEIELDDNISASFSSSNSQHCFMLASGVST